MSCKLAMWHIYLISTVSAVPPWVNITNMQKTVLDFKKSTFGKKCHFSWKAPKIKGRWRVKVYIYNMYYELLKFSWTACKCVAGFPHNRTRRKSCRGWNHDEAVGSWCHRGLYECGGSLLKASLIHCEWWWMVYFYDIFLIISVILLGIIPGVLRCYESSMLAMLGQVDDYCFDSCGYSCNMHSGLSYDTCINWAWPWPTLKFRGDISYHLYSFI